MNIHGVAKNVDRYFFNMPYIIIYSILSNLGFYNLTFIIISSDNIEFIYKYQTTDAKFTIHFISKIE